MARGKKKESLTPEERLQAALVPESEQPYPVPWNWCWTRMENIAQWGSGGTPSRKIPEYYSGDIPWIKTGELNDDYIFETEEHITEEAISHSSAKLFPVNTVAIAMYGATIGKVGILGIAATTNQACACGVSNPSANYKYLFYYARSQKDNFIKKGKGGAQPNISQEIIKSHEFPLPPLSEQHRIVDRIESLFAKLDEAKQKAQDALDSFETRKAAILHKAFTGELTAQWRKEHGVGMESWRTVTFKDACLKITDGTHHSPVNTPTGEYMYVTAKNIKETGIDLTNITFVSKDVHDEIYSRCDVQYGDVLYIKDGATTGIATVNTIEEPFSLLSSVAVLRPDKKQIMAEYMVYNLNSSKTKAMMINNMSGNAITRLTLSKIKTAPITVCSLNEQAETVRLLDNLLAKEQQAKETAEGVLEQIDLIKKSILARAFRGGLGTNDPSEESAIKLLERSFSETIESEKVRHKQVSKQKAEVVFVPKTIMEALATGVRLTPENLKRETELPIDDFYARLKELIDNGSVVESRENGESYLEAANENRQAENQRL